MHPNPLTRATRFAALLLLLLLLAACNAGYQQVNGAWVFVEIDEGRGRTENAILGVDAATFKPFKGSEFAVDRQRVYYRGTPLDGADAASFQHLRASYWADKNRVYYFDDPLPGSDPATFRFLRYFWTRDAHNVYSGADPVNPKDLATFRVIDANWAQDAQWYYPAYYGHHVPIKELDYATFRIIKGGWAKDCCRVYYFDRVVEGADPATFEALNNVRGRDKAYYYLTGSRQRTVQEELELQQRKK